MSRHRYRVVFASEVAGEAAGLEVDAEQIGHVHDGTISWLNFHDGGGEVLRLRSDSVERVERLR